MKMLRSSPNLANCYFLLSLTSSVVLFLTLLFITDTAASIREVSMPKSLTDFADYMQGRLQFPAHNPRFFLNQV